MFRHTLLVTAGLTLASNTLANETELQELRERLEALERQQQAESPQWTERIAFAGLVEVEAGYTDNDSFEDKSSSDIVLATAAFGLVAKVTETIYTEISVLYEEDRTDLEIDIASITIDQFIDGDGQVILGQFYQPFGAFNSHMVNDTLALDLAENRNTAAMLDWDHEELRLAGYIFSGDVDSGGNTLKNFGLSAEYRFENVNLAAEYISNVYNSLLLSEAVGDEVDNPDPALILRATAELRQIELIAEYLHSDELNALGDISPEALQLEAAVEDDAWVFATSAQITDDAVLLGLPEYRWSLSVGYAFHPNVSVAVEYWLDRDYDEDDGGSDDWANSVVGQFSVFF